MIHGERTSVKVIQVSIEYNPALVRNTNIPSVISNILGFLIVLLRDGPLHFQGGGEWEGYVFFKKKILNPNVAEQNNVMLNSGEKKFALTVTKKNILTRVVRKQISERNQKHTPPMQVKRLVPNGCRVSWLKGTDETILCFLYADNIIA